MRVTIEIPPWLARAQTSAPLPGAEERMRVVVGLARENVRRGSGGPFAAAVVGPAGRLVAAGVNLVVTSGNSTAHAEMVALQLAETRLRHHDLASAAGGPYELVSSVEPCLMCLGAVVWSGVQSLVCGARDADARAVGFDEGPKPADWVRALQSRGIVVRRDVLADEAARVLRDYAAAGGPVYNPRRGPPGSGQPA